MAQAVEVFRRNMLEARTLREQEAAEHDAEIEKQTLQRQMADRFEAHVKSVVAAVAKAIRDRQRPPCIGTICRSQPRPRRAPASQ
jgi:methyl-accepting chemotaxis protein